MRPLRERARIDGLQQPPCAPAARIASPGARRCSVRATPRLPADPRHNAAYVHSRSALRAGPGATPAKTAGHAECASPFMAQQFIYRIAIATRADVYESRAGRWVPAKGRIRPDGSAEAWPAVSSCQIRSRTPAPFRGIADHEVIRPSGGAWQLLRPLSSDPARRVGRAGRRAPVDVPVRVRISRHIPVCQEAGSQEPCRDDYVPTSGKSPP